MNLRSLRRPIIGGPKVNSDLSLRALVELLSRYEEIPIEDVNGQVLDVIGRFSGDAATAGNHPFKTRLLPPQEPNPNTRRVGIVAAGVTWNAVFMPIWVSGTVMNWAAWETNVLPAGIFGQQGWVCLKGTIDETDDFLGIVTKWELIWSINSVPANSASAIYRPVAFISAEDVVGQYLFYNLEGMRMGPPGSAYTLWSL